jgi:tetratricopeptide (TPR) repeat protein
VRSRGRLPYVLPPSGEALLTSVAAGTPVLVLQKLGAGPWPGWHYAVLIGYDLTRDRVVLRSGTTRRREMSAAHFLTTWERAGRWGMTVHEPGALPANADFARYMEAAAGLEAVGRTDDARRAYETAAREWPAESLPQLALANLAFGRGDLTAAERGFREAARLDPVDAAARNNRAEVLRLMGCPSLARREIEVARVLAGTGPLAAAVESTAGKLADLQAADAAGCPPD